MAIEAPILDDYFTGEDKTLAFTIYQADGVTPQPLTAFAAISWMLKRRPADADADALIEKTLVSGITITDSANGVIAVALTDTDIDNVRADVPYHHELKRMDAGFETVLSYGAFQLGQAVHGT